MVVCSFSMLAKKSISSFSLGRGREELIVLDVAEHEEMREIERRDWVSKKIAGCRPIVEQQ